MGRGQKQDRRHIRIPQELTIVSGPGGAREDEAFLLVTKMGRGKVHGRHYFLNLQSELSPYFPGIGSRKLYFFVFRHCMYDNIYIYWNTQRQNHPIIWNSGSTALLPLPRSDTSCIRYHSCISILEVQFYATLNYFLSQLAKRQCVGEDGSLYQPIMGAVALRIE